MKHKVSEPVGLAQDLQMEICHKMHHNEISEQGIWVVGELKVINAGWWQFLWNRWGRNSTSFETLMEDFIDKVFHMALGENLKPLGLFHDSSVT